jgi:uncharacterized membrane protein
MDSKLKWILLVSLLINAALVGFMIGNMGRGGFRGGPGMNFNRQMSGPARGNDQAAREALREAFQAERPAMTKALQDLGQARGESAAIIRAETLDAAALEKSMAEMRAHSSEAMASFHRSIAAAAAKLDPPRRAGLARMLDREPGRGMGGLRRDVFIPNPNLPQAPGEAPPPGQ